MKEERSRMIPRLFFTFFKIGAFTFGGGYAMMPLLREEVVEKHEWIDDEEMLDIFAISESTPGPVAINMATFLGYTKAGFWGSFFATLGVVLPSVIVILLVSKAYDAFRTNIWVDRAFKGVQAAVSVLLINNVIKLLSRYKGDKLSLVLAFAAFVLLLFFKVKAIYMIIAAILAGVVLLMCGIQLKDDKNR